ncbi:MAG: signal peptidase II [Deltaproteobacteria bacterium RIFCSPHIGHO2_12_FULL_43_9]|nr:MAG: signal peptidase II [Deltaproteobacteria bacterium RIFCSPHIGHO2_12_FULL_43_9]
MKNRYLVLCTISCAIVILDQISKFLIVTNLQLGEHIVVIQNFFHITRNHNTGAAFGILRNAPDILRLTLLLSLPIIAVVIILNILKTVSDKWRVTALALIMGGAVGNFIDRLRLQHVVDFLDFFYQQWHYPAFNIADSSICVGFGMWLIYLIRQTKK